MRNTIFIIGLLLVTGFSLMAQTEKSFDIKKETFKLKIKVVNATTFKVESFTSSWGQKIKAEVVNSKELANLKLKPGSTIEGSFRFWQFASAGGLGTTRFSSDGGLGGTRIVSGQGSGTYRFSKVLDSKRKVVGCPPLCKKSIKLKLKIKGGGS